VRPGDLFVALPGNKHDGHDYYREAVERGAVAIVAEQMLPAGVPTCIVDDARDAYGRICQALAGNPSRQMKVVGITGTNGKTTTTQLAAGVLRAAGRGVGTLGTLGIDDSLDYSPAGWTTPPAPVLAKSLGRMVANDCSHAVMEVSSHALSQHRVAGIQFDAAIFTNVRRDHLDYHGNLQNYRSAKARLLDHLSPEGVVVTNADDPQALRLVADCHHPVITYGMDDVDAAITAEVVERFSSEQTFLITAGSETAAVRTRMIGDCHIYNCLAAAALGLVQGMDIDTIVRGLESVEQVPGRMERVECGQEFSVFVDYAHTPDALATSLQTLQQVTAGRVICVFGAGGDRDREKRPLMGEAVGRWADLCVVTNDNPRGEDPKAIARQVRKGCGPGGSVHQELDRAEAIAWALAEAQPGDSVLVAGKGHEDYQEVGKQRFYFDDREVVRDLLYRTEDESSPLWALS
jgi:UDP-N-acetylmuramoyl-L-alanyl-D-glutamate--2,6-diaminopimelate ligase